MTIDNIYEKIKFYDDFPCKGIKFIDLLTLLSDAKLLGYVTEQINNMISAPNIATPEARGFIFAAPVLAMDKGVKSMIPFRKSGKLPAAQGDLHSISIVKEYGDDNLYFRRSDLDSSLSTNGVVEITIFDDVLATGGTAESMAIELNGMDVLGGKVKVKEFVFLAEIEAIGARERLSKIAPVKSLLKF